jgi:hypothetical protein
MIETILFILALHWIGDFICQSRWMADNKSKNPIALSVHVLTYGFILTTFLAFGYPVLRMIAGCIDGKWEYPPDMPMLTFLGLVSYVGVNMGLHWFTDLITSQFTKYFWNKKNVSAFFSTIGFDQLIHSFCLVLTIKPFLFSYN